MTASAAPQFLTQHREALERALQDAVGDDQHSLARAARYVLGWENADGSPANNMGKRIRPALCLLAAEAFGGAASDALPAAVAVELVHNFSLVHDEIQDHDAERHHRPTIWARFGDAQAINVGDYLYMRAMGALAEAPGDPARRLAALRVLNTAIGSMIAGQWEDISFESREHVTVDEYLSMVAGKTGALLGAPLEMGAIMAGADPAGAVLLGRWGRQVGLAFQAQDDYLGIWGNPDQTGKSNTNDIARHKKSLPVVHALNNQQAAPIIRKAYAKREVDQTSIAAVVTALEAAGSDEICRQLARGYAAEADHLLARLEFPEPLTARFREVASYLVDRSF
jgi:geranylgeranyl diphosphate synthase type I